MPTSSVLCAGTSQPCGSHQLARPPLPCWVQDFMRGKGIQRPVEVETRTLDELREVRLG